LMLYGLCYSISICQVVSVLKWLWIQSIVFWIVTRYWNRCISTFWKNSLLVLALI
jgi:hypothetical protein